MSIRLVNPYVLVKRDEPMTKTPGGLLIPDMGLKKSYTGTVVAVGVARWESGEKMDFDVEVGDRIQFKNIDGETMVVDGEELHLLAFSQVIGVLE